MSDSIAQRFDAACQANPATVALLDGAGREITFERLYYGVHALAHRFSERGVRPGANLTLHVDEPALRLTAILAVLRLGARIAIFKQRLPGANEQSSADFHVVDAKDTPPGNARQLAIDATWFERAPGPAPQRGNGGIVVSTSGTTGTRKLLGLSERVVLARLDFENAQLGIPSGAMLVGYSSTTPIGFRYTLTALLAGVPALRAHGDAAAIGHMIRLGVRSLMAPPLAVRRLVEFTRTWTGERPRLEEIRVGAAAMASHLAREAELLFSCRVTKIYGATETSLVCGSRVLDFPDAAETIGPILPGFGYRFLDEAGAEASEGELHVRVPAALRASQYFNAPGPYDADGWVATGDVGCIDADGNLELRGRKSEFINAGGTKKEPGYFERLASRIPGVTAAAAFSLKNDWGSEDVGLLMVSDRVHSKGEMARALGDARAAGFAFKIFYAAEIPHSEASKVDRRSLSALYAEAPAAITIGS